MQIKDLDFVVKDSEYCYRSSDDNIDINYSSIIDKLIKEAAKCKRYSSDIIISLKSFENNIPKKYQGEDFCYYEYFGFREMGIDHEKFIKCNLDILNDWRDYYRDIYVLKFATEKLTGKISITLFEAV